MQFGYIWATPKMSWEFNALTASVSLGCFCCHGIIEWPRRAVKTEPVKMKIAKLNLQLAKRRVSMG